MSRPILVFPRARVASRRPTSAFTLIELLTVIAIIGILAAIIIPTVGRVRETARSAQCTSNLREVSNLYQLDVQDNRGMIPVNTTPYWIDSIALKYFGAEGKGMGQALGCPVQINLKGQPLLDTSNNNKRAPRTYSINRDLNRRATAPYVNVARSISTFTSPSRTALAGDGNDSDNAPNYYNAFIGSGGRPPQKAHNGNRANIVFLDGHVQSVSDLTLLDSSTPAVGTPAATFWFGD